MPALDTALTAATLLALFAAAALLPLWAGLLLAVATPTLVLPAVGVFAQWVRLRR